MYTLQNAHLSICILALQQVPPAPANNQREDIPPPDRGAAEPGINLIDPAYQSIVNYHPQPLAVSNFHLSDGPLFDQQYSCNRILHTYFLTRDMRRVSQYKFRPILQWVSIHFS
jgi:hypothetical protein